jgi:hypothetical protein
MLAFARRDEVNFVGPGKSGSESRRLPRASSSRRARCRSTCRRRMDPAAAPPGNVAVVSSVGRRRRARACCWALSMFSAFGSAQAGYTDERRNRMRVRPVF